MGISNVIFINAFLIYQKASDEKTTVIHDKQRQRKVAR